MDLGERTNNFIEEYYSQHKDEVDAIKGDFESVGYSEEEALELAKRIVVYASLL